MMRFRTLAATAGLLSLVVMVSDHAHADALSKSACLPLRIEPGNVRVATASAVGLHAVGGSGASLFALEGEVGGARIEPGGGLRTGSRAAHFRAVARDGMCGVEARADVEVVGPFAVEPRVVALPPGGSVRFVATGALGSVVYRVLDAPAGSGVSGSIDAQGTFSAGALDGTYQVEARDTYTGREARLTVTTGKLSPLRARSAIVAVPEGGRVRLEWRGGSGSITTPTASAGKVVLEDGVMLFDARDAPSGATEIAVSDAVTHETSTVRVIIGETLGAPSIVRGTQTSLGDLASGDLNGDGRADLVIGHAERSKTAFEAGGILVAYGKEGSTLADPVVVIEGDHAGDHHGTALVVTDMNGDGIDDLLSGVPEEDLGENDRGAVSIYLGSKAGLEKEPDRVLAGESPNHRFGSAVIAADLDGDGAPEIIASAPGAKNPFAPACEGGRVYVIHNEKRARGVMAAFPSQVIDVREPLSDLPEAPTVCSPTPLGAGRALAVIDLDNDKNLDLVVGAPGTSFPTAGRSQGSVLVYRGGADGKFADTPTWAIHLDPSIRVDGAAFGSGLDVVRDSPNGPAVLLVRAPFFTSKGPTGAALAQAGGMWIFAPGSLGPLPPKNRVRVLTTNASSAHFYGASANRGVGRSAALGNVDPLPGTELVVGAVSANAAPGTLFVFSVPQILKGTLAPIAELSSTGSDLEGMRVTRVGLGSEAGGLAVLAPWRTTAMGPLVGAIDFVAPSASPLASRWGKRRSLLLANFGAGDRAGAAVAFAAFDRTANPVAVVGAPGAHSPATGVRPAGERLRTGTVDLFTTETSQPIARAWVDRDNAQLGGGPMISLDFDGDGAADIAVGDPNESAGGSPGADFVDPDGCLALDAKGANPASVAGRGVVRIYSLVKDALVEKFRITAPRENAHEDGGPKYWQNRTGFAIAAGDVNGDKKDDLVIGRPGNRDSGGAEVVLGRKPDPSGKIVLACNVGPSGARGAFALRPAAPADPVHVGLAVAAIGDLDRDGCDEIALSMSRANFVPGNPARAGILVAFGYDATGARCQGRRTPFLLRLVPDDHPLANNVAGDATKRADDTLDLRGAPSTMGQGLARGSGDFTGDGVPDLVYRDLDLAFGGLRGPAIEIISGAFLASLCPHRICPEGRSGALWSDGDWHVLAVHTLGSPSRRILPSNGVERGFGASIALGDLTGDHVAELAIGGSDDSDEGAFAGEVRVLRGGAVSDGVLLGDPWLTAVGNLSERSAFGSSVALARHGSAAWLLVGAPVSSRRRGGGSIGAAYRFKIEDAR
jgi:hypothetical protein